MKYGKLSTTRFNSFLDITLHSSFFAVPNRETELVLQFQKLSLDFWLSESMQLQVTRLSTAYVTKFTVD